MRSAVVRIVPEARPVHPADAAFVASDDVEPETIDHLAALADGAAWTGTRRGVRPDGPLEVVTTPLGDGLVRSAPRVAFPALHFWHRPIL